MRVPQISKFNNVLIDANQNKLVASVLSISRYFISVATMFCMLLYSIDFANAGSNYYQALAFRPMCIALGLLVIVNIDFDKWLTIWSLIYIPICYAVTHYGYLKHKIYDVNNYLFPEVIRQGKIVALVWGIIIIAVVRDVIKNKCWKRIKEIQPVIGILMTIFLALLVVFMRKNYDMSFVVVEVIGLAYVMKDESRRKIIINAVVDALILSFFFVAYKSLRHRPYDVERYLLYYSNSNMAGTYLACVAVAWFTRLNAFWKTNVKKWVKVSGLISMYIVIGFLCSTVLLNYTRTTILGVLFGLFAAMIIELIKDKKKGMVVLRYGLAVLSLVVMFKPTFSAYRNIPAYYAAYVDAPVMFAGEDLQQGRVKFGDSMDSPKYTSMQSYLRLAFGKWGILIDFENKESDKELSTSEKFGNATFDGRDVTNGRTYFWKLYAKNLNATGHYPLTLIDERMVERTDPDGTIIPKLDVYGNPVDPHIYHAHNSYLTVAYQFGVIEGVVYLVLVLVAFVWGVMNLIKKDDSDGMHMFAFLAVAVCMMSQVTEWITRPQYVIFLLLLLGIIELMYEIIPKKSAEVKDEA